MSEISGSTPKEMRDQQSYIPQEVTTMEDMIKFWTVFIKNSGKELPDPEENRKLIEKEATETMREQNDPDARHCYVIKDGDEVIATSMTRMIEIGGKRFGYNGYLTVNQNKTEAQQDENKKKKFHDRITDVCEDRAKKDGCDYLCASVNCDNSIGLKVKFDRNYYLNELVESIDEEGNIHRWFNVIKEPKPDVAQIGFAESKMVDFSNLDEIRSLLDSGWLGTKIVGVPSDQSNEKVPNWRLQMEKPKPNIDLLPKIG